MRTTVLAALLFSCPVALHCQDLRTTAAAKTACGPTEITFEKGDGLDSHPATVSPQPGKALVYIFGMNDPVAATCIGHCGAVIKIGLDAKWTGALWGNSFLVASVDPGMHHLCANWQTRSKALAELVSLAPLSVEAGKTYYFAAHVAAGTNIGDSLGISFFLINEDEGKMLREAYPQSKAEPKR